MDPAVRDAILIQQPVVDYRPHSQASRCFRILAMRVSGLTPLGGPGVRLVSGSPGGNYEGMQCA